MIVVYKRQNGCIFGDERQQNCITSKRIKELEATKLYLEQEVAVYKSILDEIKSLLKNNETVKK